MSIRKLGLHMVLACGAWWLTTGATGAEKEADGKAPVEASSTKDAEIQADANVEERIDDRREDYELSVTLMQLETFASAFEVWSPRLIAKGYWRHSRFGGGVTLHQYDETDNEGRLQRIQNIDYALGFATESGALGGSMRRLRSVFLGGYATLNRHANIKGREPRPTSYGYFDMRHGLNLIPPTHEVSDLGGDTLLELGVGFRWNFIGSRDEPLHVGSNRIREFVIYPFFAGNMFL